MTRLPAKVLIVHRLGDQYLITVQVSEKHRCVFGGLSFGEKKPYLASYRNGWLDLVYCRRFSDPSKRCVPSRKLAELARRYLIVGRPRLRSPIGLLTVTVLLPRPFDFLADCN